jgi:glycosyltransferase involved in cell wall biosynthesis
LDDRLLLAGADAQSIASGIRYWREHPREVEKLRPRCRAYVCEKFTWDCAVAALADVLESAAARLNHA